MNALITGGAGFIGSHLAEYLVEQNCSVTIIDNFVTGKIDNLKRIHNQIEIYNEDIEKEIPIRIIGKKKIDVIYHLAALADIVPSIENPSKYMRTNVQGTVNALEFARKVDAKRFIYTASSTCYGLAHEFPTHENSAIDLQYPYALSKYIGEQIFFHWINLYKMNGLSLRLFNVYGPRAKTSGQYGAVLGVFLAQKQASKPLTVVGDGRQVRDFTYVTDVAKAFYLAGKSKVNSQAINIGTGNPRSILDLVEILKSPYVNVPKRPGEPNRTHSSTQKALDLLNWSADISLEEGIALTLKDISFLEDAPVWTPESIDHATKIWFKYLGK